MAMSILFSRYGAPNYISLSKTSADQCIELLVLEPCTDRACTLHVVSAGRIASLTGKIFKFMRKTFRTSRNILRNIEQQHD